MLKQMIAAALVGVCLLGNCEIALAADTTQIIKEKKQTIEENKIKGKEAEEIVSAGVDDLPAQLNQLYIDVGKSLNLNYMYVKMIHIISGGKAVYADKRPNIYSDLTVDTVEAPFDLLGEETKYNLEAPWAKCPDENISRPNKYYLPDAAYSVVSDIVKHMNNRYYADRGQMQVYFDVLAKDVKTNIIFCEAVLEYLGADKKAVDSFYMSYEKILYEKEKNENVAQIKKDGTYTIKKKFRNILISNNIADEKILHALGVILSFDGTLAASSTPETIAEEYVLPYKLNYTSRENMMLAAMSLVGKVRYVWGGGHLDTGTINGINNSWIEFYNTYPNDIGKEGYGKCIQPSNSWCPLHGYTDLADGCLPYSKTIYSVDDYIADREGVFNTEPLKDDKYSKLMNKDIDFGQGVLEHRLDGLDCSGYACWLYNQITDDIEFDSSARYFIGSGGLRQVAYGDSMLPGDVFSWGTHIVVVVGAVRSGSNAYVILESSPNCVKFGAMYYSNATQSDISEAHVIAREANDLLGGLTMAERTNIYNMDNLGYYEVEIEDTEGEEKEEEKEGEKDEENEIQEESDKKEVKTETQRYAEIGRLPYSYLDEDIIINEYKMKLKDMGAKDIIQYTIDNMNIKYLTGIESYTGSVFDVSKLTDSTIEERRLKKNEKSLKAELRKLFNKAVVLDKDLAVLEEDNGKEILLQKQRNEDIKITYVLINKIVVENIEKIRYIHK